jgi:hypothetical protein
LCDRPRNEKRGGTFNLYSVRPPLSAFPPADRHDRIEWFRAAIAG